MTKSELIEFEEKVAEAFERGEIKAPVHLSGGNEDQLLTIFKQVNKDDWVFSTHRNHYHYLLHTGDKEGLWNEIMGKSTGICGGMSRSMHTCNIYSHFICSAIVAGCVAIAVGVALGLKMQKSKRKVWIFIGDAATDSGWFFEALRYAEVNDLPIKFVIENNNRSVETAIKDRWGKGSIIQVSSSKMIVYNYVPTYPHVGTNKGWVNW
jgi:TPP-dependent pyruvate/acetoin dehydrogenase alpha subunit